MCFAPRKRDSFAVVLYLREFTRRSVPAPAEARRPVASMIPVSMQWQMSVGLEEGVKGGGRGAAELHM